MLEIGRPSLCQAHRSISFMASSSLAKFLAFGKEHGPFVLGFVTFVGSLVAGGAVAWGSYVDLESERQVREIEVAREVVLGKTEVEKAKQGTAELFLQLGYTAEYEAFQI